jgi:hypothetical protein
VIDVARGTQHCFSEARSDAQELREVGTTRRRLGNREWNGDKRRTTQTQDELARKKTDHEQGHRRHRERQQAEIVEHQAIVFALLVVIEGAKTGG